MIDIRFNPKEVDILLIQTSAGVVPTYDFWLGDDASTGEQNGFIMLSTTCVNHTNPSFGLNKSTLLNAPITQQLAFFNAWKTACKKDGAQTFDYNISETNNADYSIFTQY